jgi:hypothetical protein
MIVFFIILGILLLINIILFQFSSGRNSEEKVKPQKVEREPNRIRNF